MLKGTVQKPAGFACILILCVATCLLCHRTEFAGCATTVLAANHKHAEKLVVVGQIDTGLLESEPSVPSRQRNVIGSLENDTAHILERPTDLAEHVGSDSVSLEIWMDRNVVDLILMADDRTGDGGSVVGCDERGPLVPIPPGGRETRKFRFVERLVTKATALGVVVPTDLTKANGRSHFKNESKEGRKYVNALYYGGDTSIPFISDFRFNFSVDFISPIH